MAVAKPALLIVHGAYFVPAIWQAFTQLAEASGFEVRCPYLPTCGDARPPTATLEDDIRVVQKAARELKSAGYPIIVLAHSFGGVVATEAITEDLYAPAPYNADTAGIIRLVYLCAYVPQPGNSIGDIFAKHGFLCDVELQFNEDGTAIPKNAPTSFYNDMPESIGNLYASKNVTHNIGLVAETKVSHTPWKEISSTYIYCDQDRAIKKPLQVAMVNDVLAAAGGQMDTVVLDAAHNPFLSVPDKLLNVLQQVWDGAK